MYLHEIGGLLWLTLWRCWLHSCRMFILLVECVLMHRDDCINCETCYFCFDPAFVWPSLGRALSLCLACKPFPGLCACTQTGRWCVSVVVIRSLSLFTNWADRCSQISSLDFCCAPRISKTLDVVHRYALYINNYNNYNCNKQKPQTINVGVHCLVSAYERTCQWQENLSSKHHPGIMCVCVCVCVCVWGGGGLNVSFVVCMCGCATCKYVWVLGVGV